MGIPTFDMWFHLAQGAQWENIGYKVPFCIDDANCKIKISYGDPNYFYSTTKKSVRIGT